ncbi:Lrp/AsnC family transcriptional regulator [Brevibacterium sp. 91QC2O2]|uniref:Lrp/AsnC family transcriptional regulator n=1 Tax=Brevibacterium TaxID=1696 RepID=UPI00211C6D62|nr:MULTISPECIES: Lrp/AsnC family transcriptional regulator [unclassified Brevibacterium]MCQ9368846.1 Lrp/AsnC family transcriptional regulator [Brevibacterium sp. 91QC2O2]MCQ9386582.1 Lrp/AsnC family transcriptional regulator [Brevibacterium sp. 68QC2CO]
MQDTAVDSHTLLSEEDLALIDAMQINPRISWADLASVIGTDATTAARRWRRLAGSGVAWTTVMPGPRQMDRLTLTYLEIDCEVDRWGEVLEWLYAQPHIATVQHLSGELTLWCSVFAPSEELMSDWIVSVLPTVGGIRRVRTSIATRIFDSSRYWRLKILDRRTSERVGPEPKRSGVTHDFDKADRTLFSLLARDTRTETKTLSANLEISQRSTQRRINQLVNAGDMEFRCDLARGSAGWHSGAILWMNVPETGVEQVGRTMVGLPETRSCAAIAGRTNFMMTVALHSAKDLYSFAQRLTSRFPHVSIVDRQIVLRQYKLYGRLLDAAGHAVCTTEVDPWYLNSAPRAVPTSA